MTKRDQLNKERITELLTELGQSGIIPEEEAKQLRETGHLGKAVDARKNTPEPSAVTRDKVSEESKKAFRDAYDAGNTEKALALVWETLTGDDVRKE
jgi:hypothetical protein